MWEQNVPFQRHIKSKCLKEFQLLFILQCILSVIVYQPMSPYFYCLSTNVSFFFIVCPQLSLFVLVVNQCLFILFIFYPLMSPFYCYCLSTNVSFGFGYSPMSSSQIYCLQTNVSFLMLFIHYCFFWFWLFTNFFIFYLLFIHLPNVFFWFCGSTNVSWFQSFTYVSLLLLYFHKCILLVIVYPQCLPLVNVNPPMFPIRYWLFTSLLLIMGNSQMPPLGLCYIHRCLLLIIGYSPMSTFGYCLSTNVSFW